MKKSYLLFPFLLASISSANAAPDLTKMKLIFFDEFNGAKIDTSKWLLGNNVSGTQWGSDSYFVTKNDSHVDEVYIVGGGNLTIRASYDPVYVDPNKWSRHWYSGMIIPLGPDGRPDSVTFRRGCYEIREKFPAGKGVWPANWAVNLRAQTGSKLLPAIELDGLEAYGINMTIFRSTTHDWSPGGAVSAVAISGLPDLTQDFHIYDYCVTDKNLMTYFDGVLKATIALPRPSTIDTFFWMTNLAMGGGWPITLPPNNHYDMVIDYVRIYSEDRDATKVSKSPDLN
jgi:beta-glucanase (GH16 family)